MSNWQASTRNQKNPPGWAKTRQRILVRDNHRCYICNQPATEVDHRTPLWVRVDHQDANLAAICTPCHRQKSQREAQAARAAHNPPLHRLTETHPGLR